MEDKEITAEIVKKAEILKEETTDKIVTETMAEEEEIVAMIVADEDQINTKTG